MSDSVPQLESIRHSGFKGLETRYPWGVIGFAATLILGLPALYLTLRELTPRVTIEVLSVANVFDVYRPLPELTIVFKGENIQEKGKNIRIVTLSLSNLGEKNVVQGDYDQNQPFGFTIPRTQIVGEPRIIRADSAYLEKHLMPRVVAQDTIEFSKVILEKANAAIFELVILQDKDAPLVITPIGKISGQRDILVVDRTDDGKIGFWQNLLHGGIAINIIRFILAALLFIALVIAIVAVVSSIHDWKSSRRRKRAENYLRTFTRDLAPDPETQKKLSAVIAATKLGPTGLKEVLEILGTPEGIQKIKSGRDELKAREESLKLVLQRQSKTAMKPTVYYEKLKFQSLAKLYDWLIVEEALGPVANPTTVTLLGAVLERSKECVPPKNADWSIISDDQSRLHGGFGEQVFYSEVEEQIEDKTA